MVMRIGNSGSVSPGMGIAGMVSSRRAPIVIRGTPSLNLESSTQESSVDIIFPDSIRPSKRFEPITAMIIGRRGRGKTLFQTGLQAIQKARYKKDNLRFKVASNYWTEFADILHPDLVTWLNEDGFYDPAAQYLYVCIDEAGSQFSNRRALSKQNVDFMQTLTQIRKLNDEMIFTTQFPQWIDLPVLYQVDLFILAEATERDMYGMPSSIDASVFDWWGQWTGNTKRKMWPPQMEDVDWEFTLHNTNSLRGKYDDKQVIPPPWAKNKNQIVRKQWGDRDMTDLGIGFEVNEHAATIMSLKAPGSLEELLEQQQTDISINALVQAAKRVDPYLKNAYDLRKKMESIKGIDMDKDEVSGRWMLRR